MATSADMVKTALFALKVGAIDYVLKPFKVPVPLDTIERALAWDPMQARVISSSVKINEFLGLPDAIAVGPATRSVCDMVRRTVPLRTAHVVAGEEIAGRRLVAHAIHPFSPRREAPFIRAPGPLSTRRRARERRPGLSARLHRSFAVLFDRKQGACTA